MDWYIHHVNTPAVRVRRVARFLEDIVGMVHGSRWLYPKEAGHLDHNPDTIAFYGEECRGIHVCKPLEDFAQNNGFLHNPTIGGHFALNVREIDAIKSRLTTAGVAYTDAGMFAIDGAVQIYFFDPSMNLIEVNEIVDPAGGTGPRKGEAQDIHKELGDWYIHHVCLSVHNLRESAEFFGNVVGLGTATYTRMEDGPNYVMFGTDNRGLHLVEPDPVAASRAGLLHNPTLGGHYCIAVEDLDAVRSKLDANNTPYSTASSYEFDGVEQLYVFDPEYRLVEICELTDTQ